MGGTLGNFLIAIVSKSSSESRGGSGWSCGGYSEGEVSFTCSNFSDVGVVGNLLSPGRFEASPSIGELNGGSLSVRGRVPTKSWE